jgi:general L-amino acid transport system substrate-binding protein
MPHLLAGFLLPDVLSKEPLTPATIYADPAWAYAMRWGTMARCLSAM